MRKIKAILCLIFILTSFNVAAQCGVKNNGSKTTILFVNGIFNNDEVACRSSESLRIVLGSEKLDIKSVNFEYFHNPNSWKDISELATQAGLSNQALSLSRNDINDYRQKLGQIYLEKAKSEPKHKIYGTTRILYEITKNLLLNNGNVVLVAHSQGNFFAEAVHAMLTVDAMSDETAKAMLKRFRIVGVGVVAHTSPNGRYISSTEDRALKAMALDNEPLRSEFKVLSRNYTPCITITCGSDIPWISYGDKTAHGFTTVYLSNVLNDQNTDQKFSTIVKDFVKASIDELVEVKPIANEIQSALEAGLYEISSNDPCYTKTYSGAYNASLQTSTYIEREYCFSDSSQSWIVSEDNSDAGAVLISDGSWTSEDNKNIKFIQDSTAQGMYGTDAVNSITLSPLSTDEIKRSYTMTVLNTKNVYEIFSTNNNSYLYQNIQSINALINAYTNSGGLMFGGSVFWNFEPLNPNNTNAGFVNYYNKSAPSTMVESSGWNRPPIPGNNDGIMLRSGSLKPSDLMGGEDEDALPFYVVRSGLGETGVREGRVVLKDASSSFTVHNRASANAALQARGLPPTLD